jgi:signal transduction histidine kinase
MALSLPELPRQTPQHTGPERILVVDDSLSALMLVKQVLEGDGFQVETAHGGLEGFQVSQDLHFDLIILDIMMPDLDGLELCRRIRSHEGTRDLPILFLTADERTTTQMDAIAAGGDDLLYKPSLQRELLIRVHSLLRIESLQALIRKDRDALLRVQQQQEQLFHFIIHDLKSPLQTIQGNSELLLLGAASGKDPKPRIELIQETVRRMSRMVQDLLDVSQGGQGSIPICVRSANVRAMMVDCAEELQPALVRRNVQVDIQAPDPFLVPVDAELIRRSLINLMDNALKYGPTRGTIRLEGEVRGEVALLRVVDEGPGVPADMRTRIFDPFIRLDRDSAQARISSGLGLAFCRMVAEAHGGRIYVEPGKHCGSAFCVEVPLAQR